MQLPFEDGWPRCILLCKCVNWGLLLSKFARSQALVKCCGVYFVIYQSKHANEGSEYQVKNMTIIEEKPAEILLHEAQRTKIHSARSSDLPQAGVAPFNPMGGHVITIPIVLHPERGQYQSPARPGNQALAALPPPLPSAVKVSVEIEQWFQEFEDNSLCNTKSLKFSEFGRILKVQGFTQITQLS